MAFKIATIQNQKSTQTLILAELSNPNPQYAAKDANEAVERVLDFERTWANYNFPRLLMSLSRIQEHVLASHDHRAGNYSFFAQQVETVFRGEIVRALDEFGIPWQIGKKLQSFVPAGANIDEVLLIIDRLDISSSLKNNLERDIVKFARSGFGIADAA